MKKLICIALVLTMALCLSACGGSGYKGVVGDFVDAVNECDGKMLLSLYPDEYLEYIEDVGYMDEDEFADYMDSFLELAMEEWEDEYGDDIKITYKITDAEKMDKDDLEDLQDEYDEMDLDIEIKEAYELEVELTIKGDDDKDTDDVDLVVIKVDGKWYLDINSGLS